MKILLAIDPSPHSAAAADTVAERPWPKGTTVRVFSSAGQPYPIGIYPWYGPMANLDVLEEESKQRAEELVSSVAARLRERGLNVETAVAPGDPRTGIVDEASRWGADLIVVGSHGYTGIRRLLLGSVAQYVVAHAPSSVEVVRQPEERA